MQSDVKHVFYFNTSASALGGYVGDGSDAEKPFRIIESHASVSLPSAGGAASDRTDNRPLDEVVSCKSTYTHVSGHAVRRNGPWVTRATSVVEGLNILNGQVTADRVVAQIFLEHGKDDEPTLIAFGRSHFTNLRLQGKQITVSLNPRLLPPHHVVDNDVYDEHAVVKASIRHSTVWNVAEDQTSAFRSHPGIPAWALARHGTLGGRLSGKTDHVLCSIVDKIEGCAPNQTYGHVVEVTDAGRFFFGEIVVHGKSLQLTMVRAELGCATTGSVSAGTAKGNGVTHPPT